MSGFGIAFDLDHTLCLDHKIEVRVGVELLAQSARSSGKACDSPEAERRVVAALEAFRTGHCSLDQALREHLGDEQVAATFRQAVVERAAEFVTPLPGAPELLETLVRMGYALAILTNGWSPLQEEKARLIGFPGTVLVSERLGVQKPAPAAFDALVRSFALPPEHISFVGDDPVGDVDGARRAGLTSVWLDRGERSFPSELPPPRLRIERLEELPLLLAQGGKHSAPEDGRP